MRLLTVRPAALTCELGHIRCARPHKHSKLPVAGSQLLSRASSTLPSLSRRACITVLRAQSETSQPSESLDVVDAQGSDQLAADDLWLRALACNKEMVEAVECEDFAQAAKSRDEGQALVKQMPPVRQFVFATVNKLKAPLSSDDEKVEAINALGQAGDSIVLPVLAECLKDEVLQPAAQEAMWATFSRSSNPEVNDLMQLGLSQMDSEDHEAALKTFDQAAQIDGTFAEAYNKKATLLYLLRRVEESVEVCDIVLAMQPLHFGALAGKGTCLLKLNRIPEALESFEAAVAINPGMKEIVKMAEVLRMNLKKEASAASSGVSGSESGSGESTGEASSKDVGGKQEGS